IVTYFKEHTSPPVFFTSAGVILLFLLIGVIFTDTVAEVANSAQDGISTYFGWFYILATSFFLVFALYLMVSRYGRIKLGPDDATPEFGNIAWFAMLFTAGMGIGLVFFSVSEPVTHFTDPPEGQGG